MLSADDGASHLYQSSQKGEGHAEGARAENEVGEQDKQRGR